VNGLRDAAFGDRPDLAVRIEPGMSALDRWLVAVALGGQGRYAAAATELGRLLADPAVPRAVAAHAAVTRAAHRRQQGGHAAAHGFAGELPTVLGGHQAGGRIREIGRSTGQATVPLAERGVELLSVELGAGLAAAASRKLVGYPNVRVVNANFETWDPGAGGFDAVVAFTAFHWIDPALRFDKATRLLRERGVLAVVETQHALPVGGDPFWIEVQEDYDAVVPSEDNRPPSPPEEIEDLSAEIEAVSDLELVAVRRYLWDVTYSPDEYIAVLETYSGHRSIEEPR